MAELNMLKWFARLVEEPALRYTPSGTAVCKIRVAANHTRYDKEANEKKEEACFLNWTYFGETAEALGKMAKKGTQLFLEGKLRQNDWTDREGKKRHDYEALGDRWQFLTPKPREEEEQPARTAPPKQPDESDLPF